MKQRCCKTCRYSRWPLTPTGKIFRDTTGVCVVPVPTMPLPVCITEAYGYHDLRRSNIDQDQGNNCPLWEENPGKPMSEVVPR